MPHSSRRFPEGRTDAGERFWVDDANVPMRCVIQRQPNRFQCYQRDGTRLVSAGYALARNDIRRFLEGWDAELYGELGVDGPFKAPPNEKLVFSFPSLEAWLSSAESAE